MNVYDDLFKKYGHHMMARDLAAEMRLALGTIRNRNQKGTLPFPTITEGQRIKAKTKDVAKYFEGE
jgi:hypothetical protein